MSKTKVAVAGAGGLGKHIVDGLLATGLYEVIILSRRPPPPTDNTSATPRGAQPTIKQVDYTSDASLTSALEGVDTLISTLVSLDSSLRDAQLALIRACLAAGVRRFAPSEFEGSPGARRDRIEFQRYKREVLEYLEREVDREKQLQWTVFSTGILYDFWSPLRGSGDTAGKDGKARLVSSPYLDPIGFSPIVDFESGRAEVPAREDGEGEEVLLLEKRIRAVRADDVGKKIEVVGKTQTQIDKEVGEAQKNNDLFAIFKAGALLCVRDGDYYWSDGADGSVEVADLLPDLELEPLEQFLRDVYGKKE
ncbi:MAG: hypothetical protein M1825_005110 [Sarcosagium campestre]|nr:MAG: hypothetical protein M1825_005110 [Sarcosagium campestre]